jgi:hypothetical protein
MSSPSIKCIIAAMTAASAGCATPDLDDRIDDIAVEAQRLLGPRAHTELVARLRERVGAPDFDAQLLSIERAIAALAEAAGDGDRLAREAERVERAIESRYGAVLGSAAAAAPVDALCAGPSFAYGRGVELSVEAEAYAAAIAGAGTSYEQAVGVESTFDLRRRTRRETAIAACGFELGPRFGEGAGAGGTIGVAGFSTLIVNHDPTRDQPLAVGAGIKTSLDIEAAIGIEIGVDAAYWYAAASDDCSVVANPVECALAPEQPAEPDATWGLVVEVGGGISGGAAGLVAGIGAATSATCTFDPPLADHAYDETPVGELGPFAAAIDMGSDIVAGGPGLGSVTALDPFAAIAVGLGMAYATACTGSRLVVDGSTVSFVDDDGAVRWTVDVDDGATGVYWPDASYRVVAAIRADLTGDGRREVVIAANHEIWFPSQIVAVAVDTGEVIARYWHPGHLRAFAATEQPVRAVVAAGGNNDLDAATVAILAYGTSGQAPPHRGDVAPAAVHLGYAVLPESGDNGANFVEQIDVEADRIVARNRAAGWQHAVSFDGRVLE